MEDLYKNTSVIRLNDHDFDLTEPVKVVNQDFKHKNGYIMFYAPWCPHCQNQVKFWTYLGDQFNTSKDYAKENFKIGVVNTTDPETSQVVQHLGVNGIPHFYHVIADKEGKGHLKDFQGMDHSPEALMQEACKLTPSSHLCNSKKTKKSK